MLKSLFPSIDWMTIKVVGFDLDGTLYDEFEFIKQVYIPISKKISLITHSDESECYKTLLIHWLEKGSSYNKIFYDFLKSKNIKEPIISKTIQDCIEIYRNYEPLLELSPRVHFILNIITDNYPCFIVTDGSSLLQNSKIKALKINKYIKQENIFISGSFGVNHQKPSSNIIEKIELIKEIKEKSLIVYFGDREIDQLFSKSANFQFVPVHCMHYAPNNLA